MRGTGDNNQMVRALGISDGNMTMLGIALSNGLIALSGALLAQYQGFADVQMGIGMVVWGLASVIIGEALVGFAAPGTYDHGRGNGVGIVSAHGGNCLALGAGSERSEADHGRLRFHCTAPTRAGFVPVTCWTALKNCVAKINSTR